MDEKRRIMVMDRATKVCICKAIVRFKIKEAIRAGADSVEKVHAATGSGSGACRGQRCGPKILTLIKDYNEGGWE